MIILDFLSSSPFLFLRHPSPTRSDNKGGMPLRKAPSVDPAAGVICEPRYDKWAYFTDCGDGISDASVLVFFLSYFLSVLSILFSLLFSFSLIFLSILFSFYSISPLFYSLFFLSYFLSILFSSFVCLRGDEGWGWGWEFDD